MRFALTALLLATAPAAAQVTPPAQPDAPPAEGSPQSITLRGAPDRATQPREFTTQRTPAPPPAPPVATAAMPFLFLAGESDVFEISSSQVALQRSRNEDVRRYAAMLIEHHTLTTNQALAAAAVAGITPPPPVLGPDKRDRITRLLSVDPAGFDREYLSQQVPAHEAALALHRTYAEGGDVAQLRTVAQGAVPIVTRHLEDARRLLGVAGS